MTDQLTATPAQDEVRAERVEINQGGAGSVDAHTVSITQGGAGQVRADEVTISQGGIGLARAGKLSLAEGGNAFAILGRTTGALRRAGLPQEEIDDYVAEATSGDYDHLLQTTMRWIQCE